jgi:hypothetical protein
VASRAPLSSGPSSSPSLFGSERGLERFAARYCCLRVVGTFRLASQQGLGMLLEWCVPRPHTARSGGVCSWAGHTGPSSRARWPSRGRGESALAPTRCGVRAWGCLASAWRGSASAPLWGKWDFRSGLGRRSLVSLDPMRPYLTRIVVIVALAFASLLASYAIVATWPDRAASGHRSPVGLPWPRAARASGTALLRRCASTSASSASCRIL